MGFDAATLARIDAAYEVDIETTRPDGTTRNTTIWAVVEDGACLVRSWKGDRGYWYQAALDRPDEVTLIVAAARLPVRAVVADDDGSIALCSRGLARKYKGDPSTGSMLLPRILHATMRLEPR